MNEKSWTLFEPDFPDGCNGQSILAELVADLCSIEEDSKGRDRNTSIEACRRRAVAAKGRCDSPGRQVYLAAAHVLTDLAKQGWSVRMEGGQVEIRRGGDDSAAGEETRDRIRGQLHAERDEQLRQPTTRSFVRSMERRQLFGDHFVSIFSLMRDGRELEPKLRAIADAPTEVERIELACAAIKPYLQFIRGEERCTWTGYRLIDIWRYFRHTWASPHKSVPGRSIMVLVRDAAAPFHPVIGIAALSSAAVALTKRDEKIGWTAAGVIEEIRERPTAKLARWLKQTVDDAIDEIFKVDFFEDETLSLRDVKRPSPGTVRKLEEQGRQQRSEHHRFMETGAYKRAEPVAELCEEHWVAQARSPLFRSKRALELAQLLSVRIVLRRHFNDIPSKNALARLVADREGREAVTKIVRRAKADRVGTAIADLTVCGALPPYNEILGGKLVAMLLVSPETIQEYQRRYGGASSIIASSMAGRAVSRSADLVFIGTTSLYGQRPSQYDRIRVPIDPEADGDGLRFEYLGRTRGIGTFQFGEQTVAEMARLLAQAKRGQQVNSVFGEGVNPRLRKIRDGLDALGLATDDLLNHGGPRLVYGVDLVRNVRTYLLGMEKTPKYILGQKGARQRTATIAEWWLKRWVVPRIAKSVILERVAGHNLNYPIKHGARVDLHEGEGYLPGVSWD